MEKKTILTYIADEKKQAIGLSGSFANGVKHILRKASTEWMPSIGYSKNEINRFASDAADIIAWAEHENYGSFIDGINYGAEKTLELLDYTVLYIVEGMKDTDLEGMVFAVCTTEESAKNAFKQTFDGKDVTITPILADPIILNEKVVRTNIFNK